MSSTDMAAIELDHLEEPEHRVTPLELFFDLVFVFAITQVTAFMAHEPTWTGLGKGLLILGVIWWAWTGYAWLTTVVEAEDGWSRIVLFIAMGGMLVASMAVPGAFDEHATVFVLAIVTVRVAHIATNALAPNDEGVRQSILRMGLGVGVSMALLLISTGLDGRAQVALWAVALIVDYASPLLADTSKWRVHAGHFAERHGLIIIIALGESIVALGLATEGLELDAEVLATAILGLVIAGALWWAYFDVVAIVAERRLTRAQGLERNRLARDSYSYLHFVMIAGIVLLALGLKKTLGHVQEPLSDQAAFALCCGPGLYLLGHVLFRARQVQTLSWRRLAAVAVLAGGWFPAGTQLDAIWTMGGVALTCVAVVAYEALKYAEFRDAVRHEGRESQLFDRPAGQ